MDFARHIYIKGIQKIIQSLFGTTISINRLIHFTLMITIFLNLSGYIPIRFIRKSVVLFY